MRNKCRAKARDQSRSKPGASVAQLAEQLTLNQLVLGSSPSRGTNPWRQRAKEHPHFDKKVASDWILLTSSLAEFCFRESLGLNVPKRLAPVVDYPCYRRANLGRGR